MKKIHIPIGHICKENCQAHMAESLRLIDRVEQAKMLSGNIQIDYQKGNLPNISTVEGVIQEASCIASCVC